MCQQRLRDGPLLKCISNTRYTTHTTCIIEYYTKTHNHQPQNRTCPNSARIAMYNETRCSLCTTRITRKSSSRRRRHSRKAHSCTRRHAHTHYYRSAAHLPLVSFHSRSTTSEHVRRVSRLSREHSETQTHRRLLGAHPFPTPFTRDVLLYYAIRSSASPP